MDQDLLKECRCPDCNDGPIPGCQWDYEDVSGWKWKECSTCKGKGVVWIPTDAMYLAEVMASKGLE